MHVSSTTVNVDNLEDIDTPSRVYHICHFCHVCHGMGGVPETMDPEQPAMSGASKGAFGPAIGQFTIKPSCAMPAP